MTPVKTASGAKAVAAGHGSLYYLDASGDLYGAGDNFYGQLGVTLAGGATSSTSFVRIASNVTKMKAGESHLLYLTAAGDLYATGLNSSGQLGDGSQVNRATPVRIAQNIADMTAGAFHSLYLTNTGDLYAFGENETGALGIESALYKRRTPVDLAAFTVTFPHCAYKTNLYLKDGTLYGFGDNNYGQLGDGSTSDRATPITIATNVASAASGLWHTLYVTSSGDLYATGDNSRGQLGIQRRLELTVVLVDRRHTAEVPVVVRDLFEPFVGDASTPRHIPQIRDDVLLPFRAAEAEQEHRVVGHRRGRERFAGARARGRGGDVASVTARGHPVRARRLGAKLRARARHVLRRHQPSTSASSATSMRRPV